MEVKRETVLPCYEGSQVFLLDPRTKMILLVFVATLTVSGDIVGIKIYFRLLLALIPAFLLFINKKSRKKAIVYTIVFVVGWRMESFLMNQFTGILGMLVLIASGLVTRFLPSLMLGYYFISSTQVDELIAALQNWHVPRQITIPVAVVFRFIPTIREESDAIKDAMRIRNVNLRMALKKPIQYMEYRFVPLMSSIARLADDLSAAALTRGLGGKAKRSSIYDVKFHLVDIFMLFVTIVMVLGYFYL